MKVPDKLRPPSQSPIATLAPHSHSATLRGLCAFGAVQVSIPEVNEGGKSDTETLNKNLSLHLSYLSLQDASQGEVSRHVRRTPTPLRFGDFVRFLQCR